ncbi:hypothetical protein HDV00_010989 [Rhizophlyctis rosea]|nr:hypothetical protein HDV00_010989 [Rhizophlyctis rosea]
MARGCDWGGLDQSLTEAVVEKIRTFTDHGGVKWDLVSALCQATGVEEKDVMETALLLRSKGLMDLELMEGALWYNFCRLIEKFPTLLTIYPAYLNLSDQQLQHALRDEVMLRIIVTNRIPLPARSLPILCRSDNQVGMKYLRRILRFCWADMACESSWEENVKCAITLGGPLCHRKRVVKGLIRNGAITEESWKRLRLSMLETGEGVVGDVVGDVIKKELHLEHLYWEDRRSRPGSIWYEKARASFASGVSDQTEIVIAQGLVEGDIFPLLKAMIYLPHNPRVGRQLILARSGTYGSDEVSHLDVSEWAEASGDDEMEEEEEEEADQ